jgi:hypothetical protein
MDGRLGVLYETPTRPPNAILDALDVNFSPNAHGRRARFSTYPPPDSAPISIPSLFHAHPFSLPYCVSFSLFPPFKSSESLASPLTNVGSFGARFPSLMIARFLTCRMRSVGRRRGRPPRLQTLPVPHSFDAVDRLIQRPYLWSPSPQSQTT